MLLLKIRFDNTNCFIHKCFKQFFPMKQKHFPQPFINREDDVAVIDLEYVLFQQPCPFLCLSDARLESGHGESRVRK